MARFFIAALVAGVIAYLARRAGSLTTGGAAAAVMIGGITWSTGWRWGVVLIAWFVASSALTRWGARAKRERTAKITDDPTARDAFQVLANGSAFALLALAGVRTGDIVLQLAALGALAAAAADTWATEIGTRWGSEPFSLRTLARVPPGTSGAITAAGSGASAVAAALVALAAPFVMPDPAHAPIVPAIFVGGVAGALADTVLGAWVQAGRICPTCGSATERLVHDCGAHTRLARGIPWMTNDTVNFLATLYGAAAAAAALAYL